MSQISYELFTERLEGVSKSKPKEYVWKNIFREFEKGDAKSIKFTLKDYKEKVLCRSALHGYRKTHKLDWSIISEPNTNCMYVVKNENDS